MAKGARLGHKEKLAAVVLSRINYGEADLIVTFLTREQGLVAALARYGRRSLRRFGGGRLFPGAVAFYDFTFKAQSDLAFVENSEELPWAPPLPKGPEVLSLADYSLELVRSFEAPANPAPEVFRLLVRHLNRLAAIKEVRLARLITLDFALKYLELAGFGPRLAGCVMCGATPQASAHWRWAPHLGGLYCPECLVGQKLGRPISSALMARFSPNDGVNPWPELSLQDIYEAELFFEKLAEQQLNRSLKAMKVARKLFRGNDS